MGSIIYFYWLFLKEALVLISGSNNLVRFVFPYIVLIFWVIYYYGFFQKIQIQLPLQFINCTNKKTQIGYFLLRPVFNVFNIYLVLLIIPLAVNNYQGYGYLCTLICSIAIISHLIFSLVAYVNQLFPVLRLILITILSVILLFYESLVLSGDIINELLKTNIFLLALVSFGCISLLIYLNIILINAFINNRVFEFKNLYSIRQPVLNIIKNEYYKLELKLICRNKRPRELILTSLFFVIYLMFLAIKNTRSLTQQIFYFILILEILPINYGRFLISWNNQHFAVFFKDGLSLRDYIKSKYLTIIFLHLLSFTITIPFILLYNLNIHYFCMLYLYYCN